MFERRFSIPKDIATAKQELIFCLLITFLWGMAGHGYFFFNNAFSHDSLDELVFFSEIAIGRKFGNGRVFWPIYRSLMGINMAYPWLIGMISLIYTGIAVFFFLRIFEVNSRFITVLVSGCLTVNATVTALVATFIHDMDCDMLAMLMSVIATFLWKRYSKGFLWGIIPLVLMFGLYQGYITVTITLVIFVCIIHILDGKSFRNVFMEGLKAVAMLIGAGICYYIVMKLTLRLSHQALHNGYNSPLKILEITAESIIPLITDTWKKTVSLLWQPPIAYSDFRTMVLNAGLCAVILIVTPIRFFTLKIGKLEILLFALLVLVLPLGMNVVNVLSSGYSQELMYYSLWMLIPFALILVSRYQMDGLYRILPIITSVMVISILWGNLMFSHEAYLVKDMEQDALLSYMTKVSYRIEENEEYIQGETTIAFIGTPDHMITLMPETNGVYDMDGMYYPYPWYTGTSAKYQCYYRYILLNPAIIAGDELVYSLSQQPEVIDLPAYPEDGFMKMIDDVLVVKLG